MNLLPLILLGSMAILSSFGMILFRSPMRIALSLIATMLSLAGIYAAIDAHVLAVFQILIYVGAVMVFMVYIILLLNPLETTASQKYVRIGLPVLIAIGLAITLSSFVPSLPSSSHSLSFQTFASTFVRDYFFYFELSSVFLLIVVIAAISILKDPEEESHD